MARLLVSMTLSLLLAGPATGQLITAHRGASHDAPENTLAAFRLAWAQAADAIEGDFRLSGDGQIVCVHDADTKRVAGVNHVVASAPLVKEIAAWRGDHSLLTIIAFDADAIAECKRALPAIRAHWLTSFTQDKPSRAWRPTAERIATTVKECGADGVGMQGQRRVIDAGFVERLTAGGIREFHVWTVDSPDDALDFRELGAMGITTNRPAFIRAALEESTP